MTSEYKVELDDFAGPLDLLLYLVRKEEVKVEGLPIARITEQFLRFVETIPQVDLDRAGDYLVMAAQLLEWKARALLPAKVAADGSGEADDIVRSALVKDLLEYRELKDRARLLEGKADEAARRFGRESPRTIEEVPSLKNVDLWDLVTAFQRLEKEIGALGPERYVSEDETPLAMFVEKVRERLRVAMAAGGTVEFRSLFPEKPSRSELVATFLALLEVIRLGEARARQTSAFADIAIEPMPGFGDRPPGSEDGGR
jgi:segregation and condensation protein A